LTHKEHLGDKDVTPDYEKIKAVQNFPTPKNAKNIKQFLRLAGYYRRFIPNFSKIAKLLTELLKKDATFVWGKEQDAAFAHLRAGLCAEPILQYPDCTKSFVVITDASGFAIGGILSQGPIGKDLPVAYTSRLLNKAEQNYSAIEKELLAIVYCVRHFRLYLYGRKFQLVTDHKPLVWVNSVKDPTSRLVRWRLKLQEYEYDIVYKAGKSNVNADALSRNPITQQALPLTIDTEPDSNESLLLYKKPRKSPTNTPTEDLPTSPKNASVEEDAEDSSTEEGIDDSGNSDQGILVDEDDSDSDSNTDSTLFDNPNEPFSLRPNQTQIIEIKNNFASRKDNLIVFITKDGLLATPEDVC